MEKLIGSITTEDFINSLLLARGVESLGDLWEHHITCNQCPFVKQCKTIGDLLGDQDKIPTCGQIIDLLLGDINVEDIK